MTAIRRISRRRLCCFSSVVLVVLLGLGVTAPARAAEKPRPGIAAAWGAPVPGTEAFVAIASTGTKVLVYVCDGASVGRWFSGAAGDVGVDLANGKVELRNGRDRVQVTLARTTATGTFTVKGLGTRSFSAGRLAGDAGIYRSEEKVNGKAATGGWIVLADGRVRGGLVVGTAFQPLKALTSAARLLNPRDDDY